MQERSAQGLYVCLCAAARRQQAMKQYALEGSFMRLSLASSHLSAHHTSGNRGTSTQAQNARLRSVSLTSSPWTDLNHCLQIHTGLAEQRASSSHRCRRQTGVLKSALLQVAAAQPFHLDFCAPAWMKGPCSVLQNPMNAGKPPA